jgi:hypothetical protein
MTVYAYVGGSPVSGRDPLGLYTEAVGWSGVGIGESQFGHFSLDVNGWNYSWAPPGQWDLQFPFAADYAQLRVTAHREHAFQANVNANSGRA